MPRFLHSIYYRLINACSGQTFSGKTYTMGSDNDAGTSEESRGIIPRAVEDIFLKLNVIHLFL